MSSSKTGNQLAGENAENTFNRRKFISVTLAFLMAVILLMAIGIVIANVSGIEDLHTFTTTAHILSGVIMFGFVVVHIKLNWKAMKSYFTRKKISTNIEEPTVMPSPSPVLPCISQRSEPASGTAAISYVPVAVGSAASCTAWLISYTANAVCRSTNTDTAGTYTMKTVIA